MKEEKNEIALKGSNLPAQLCGETGLQKADTEKRFNHVMLDIETLGLSIGSVIRSVALVEFDPQTGETGRSKVWKLDMQQAVNEGFRIEPATVKWWLTKSESARKDFVEGKETGIIDFVNEMWDFLAGTEAPFTLWCLQLDFDIPMLKAYFYWFNTVVFGKENEELPWDRRMIRDVRPYMDALQAAGLLPPKQENRHTPLTDCLAQIGYVHLANKHKLNVR